jgi:GAF domain-containing protein
LGSGEGKVQRRGAVSRKAAKTRRRKPTTSKRSAAPNAVLRARSSVSDLQDRLERQARELDEAHEQQTAAAEVLRLISISSGDLQRVFAAILENATRLCQANFGTLLLCEGDFYRQVAFHNAPPAFVEARRLNPMISMSGSTALARLAATKQPVHIADVASDPAYQLDPQRRRFVTLTGVRTNLAVPMLIDDKLIGAINIYRTEVHPFTDKQIALVQNFAAQAVIAIENTRLLNELREALQQQTATADVLKVISSSPGDLEPVFQSMLENAVRLCEANFAMLFLYEGGDFRAVCTLDVPRAWADWLAKNPIRIHPRIPMGRAVSTKKPVHVADARTDQSYLEGLPGMVGFVELGGGRTLLQVPMLKENEVVGMIGIFRQEVRPFTDKQIELVENFAAQAVIAIENTRLLNELRQRTTDLTESLEQQTATAEVLSIISSSPRDLGPVFQSMLENTTRICEAKFGHLRLYENETFRLVAMHNVSPAFADGQLRSVVRPGPLTPIARVAATKQFVHVPDYAEEPAYKQRDPGAVRLVELGGVRTLLVVPMLKESELIGTIAIYRQEVRPFTDKQIALVQNFAAQAVIAIENTRLLNELRESYGLVRQQAGKLEAQSQELVKLNQQLEQRVADQVGEIERMGRLRRFLPPQVADLIVASGTEKQLESHRREITALFCDLRGFTGFSESSDPEDVMALLREYHAAIGEIIIKYSGTLERFAGDGVMVVFNDPVPVPNPALQAVLMALDMRMAIGALIDRWRQLGHDLGFGIGVSHGFATLGTIGFEGRFDYAAIGTVSNVASRLCDEAKPGQILISPRVLMAVKEAVTAEPMGEFTLKGIRRPMLAYNVLDRAQSKKLN